MLTRLTASLCVVALLSGCTSKRLEGDHKRSMRPPGDEGPHLAVPYFADRRDQWGPASLAGILSFWGKRVTPDDVRKQVHFPKQPGSVQLDMKYAARSYGLEAEMRNGGSLPWLKAQLDAGRPVLVLLDIGAKWAPVRSFTVVTGYNQWLHGVYAHFGPKKDFFISYKQFDEDWKRAGRWFLSVGPKEEERREPPAITQVSAAPQAPPAVVCPPEEKASMPAKRRKPAVKCVQYAPIVPVKEAKASQQEFDAGGRQDSSFMP
jgi:hypothetical protein